MTAEVEDLLHRLAPRVLGALVRRNGGFDECEDAVQEALLAAAQQWPVDGLPDHPEGWLVTVASRRLTDHIRSEVARRRREQNLVGQEAREPVVDGPDADHSADSDDTLTLLFLCCHPSLTPASQVALTLRAVGGLSTEEIARAFLASVTATAQRISRAKQRIRTSGIGFAMPPPEEQPERLEVVLRVLYLIFNEGYATTSGPELQRADLTREAIRLTREVHRLRPDDGEVAGLLALMILTDARRAARTDTDGHLVPLDQQDRDRWDHSAITEGVELITATLPRGPTGPYQVQAAIAALHDEADRAEDTDWPQILVLYDLLRRVSPSPTVELNRAVAVAMVHGPTTALPLLDALAADERLTGGHRLEATRAHLLEMAGDQQAARSAYLRAADRTTSEVERGYLTERATRLGPTTRSPARPG